MFCNWLRKKLWHVKLNPQNMIFKKNYLKNLKLISYNYFTFQNTIWNCNASAEKWGHYCLCPSFFSQFIFPWKYMQFFISAGCWKDCCYLFLSGSQVFHLHPQPSPSVHASSLHCWAETRRGSLGQREISSTVLIFCQLHQVSVLVQRSAEWKNVPVPNIILVSYECTYAP